MLLCALSMPASRISWHRHTIIPGEFDFGAFDFILADPPRAGLGEAASQHLAGLGPPKIVKIVIVSCDPATLKDYEIEELILVDLFSYGDGRPFAPAEPVEAT